MDTDGWPLVKDRFNDALALHGDERRRMLDTLDAAVRSQVEALLAAAEVTGGVLDAPLDTSLLPTGVDSAAALDAPAPGAPQLEPSPLSAEGPLTDAVLGPYRVGPRIGRGGMGEVYRARRDDGLFDRVVALKVVREGADSDAVLARFAAERRILGSLEHPGIARLIAAGAEAEGAAAGRPWLALELVEGVPIVEAARTLDLGDRVALLADVAEAVHHAHRRLVVHRDLKPSNVLVTRGEDGTRGVKLLDFGIAKLLDQDDVELTTLHARTPMTRAYAAPEQIRGEPVTTATDVYGLGLLLFETLTGRRPFATGGTVFELERDVLETPAPLASLSTDPQAGGVSPRRLRGDLDVICRTALAKAPEARYASAEALAADLRRWQGGQPIAARAPSAGYRAWRFLRRHRIGVAAVTVAVLAVLGGAASTALQARQTRIEAERSAATAAFLAGLFEDADPTIGGRPPSELDLVDRGARRIDTELAGQPDVRARLLSVMAAAYLGLGRPDSAEALARRALALRRPGGPAPDPAEAVRARVRIGQAQFARRPAEGARELSAAVAAARGLGNPAVLLDALEAQAELAGNEVLTPTETLAVLDEAVALCRRLEGEGSPRLGRLLSLLAFKVSSARQHGRVEGLLREALANLPADRAPYERSAALIDLAELLHMTGQADGAREAIDEALALRRRALEPGDARIAEALATRARVGGRGAGAAERDAREALALATAAGDDALRVETLNALGAALLEQERYDEATDVFRRRLALAAEVFGTESTRYPAASRTVGRALHQAGRYGEAAQAWDESIRLVAPAYGPESAMMVSTLLEASRTEEARGEARRAERMLAQAYEAGSGLAVSSGVRARSALHLGRLRLDDGRPAEAVEPLRRALEGRDALDRPGHRSEGPDGDRAAALLGRALVATGAVEEGRRFLEAAVPVLARELGSDHAETERARRALRR